MIIALIVTLFHLVVAAVCVSVGLAVVYGVCWLIKAWWDETFGTVPH